MKTRISYLFILIAGVVLAMSLSLYTIDTRQSAIVFHLGTISAVERNPGLYFKWPFLDSVDLIDTRVMTLAPVNPSHFTTMEQQGIDIAYFAKWHIIDPQRYYTGTGNDENRLRTLLARHIDDHLRKLIAQYTLADLVAGDRNRILDAVHVQADQDAQKFGVQIIDVRIRDIDLPPEAAAALSQQMAAAEKTVMAGLRATGVAEANQIHADADKQHDTIIAQAYQHAQETKGDADAKASAIYAAAYGKDPEFYAFYRSLSVYRDSLGNKNHVLLLDARSPFFHYLTPPTNGKPSR